MTKANHPQEQTISHTHLEDIIAMVIGTTLIAMGLNLYKDAGLLSGGLAGVAFILHYALKVPLGLSFFLLNIPFYLLAIKRMGIAFTLKTFSAVTLLSLMTTLIPMTVTIGWVHPAHASINGGILLGIGTLVLFRHRTSLGGIGIAVLYLQNKFGWRAGNIQMLADSSIVLCALLFIEPSRVMWSVLSAITLNLILSINHREGRYQGE
jgi:uncharacterized membrane-anchored protein YitT (DUF2179 family)